MQARASPNYVSLAHSPYSITAVPALRLPIRRPSRRPSYCASSSSMAGLGSVIDIWSSKYQLKRMASFLLLTTAFSLNLIGMGFQQFAARQGIREQEVSAYWANRV